MAVIRWAPPPDVRQDYGDTCWAAVMEAFCQAAPGRPKVTQSEIVEQFEGLCVSDRDGTMTRRGLHVIFRDLRFGLDPVEVAPGAFSDVLMKQKLGRGHVLLGYWERQLPGWHVGLAYGLSGQQLSYLNPDYRNGGLIENPIAYFKLPRGNLIVAARRW